MEERQFDELIRSKYFEDEDEPVWDKTKVWESIQPTKQYCLKCFKYAASLALLIGSGTLYFIFFSDEKIKNNSILTLKIKEKSVDKFTYTKPDIKMQKSNLTKVSSKKTVKNKPFLEKYIENSAIKSTQEVTLSTISEPKSNVILEKKIPIETTKPTTENLPTNNVIVLNIPMEEDLKPKRKKRAIGRFLQQIGRYSNGEKFDWEEVNIKPKKVWAYFKNSFVADSTTIY
jgi:hypothetical protein